MLMGIMRILSAMPEAVTKLSEVMSGTIAILKISCSRRLMRFSCTESALGFARNTTSRPSSESPYRLMILFSRMFTISFSSSSLPFTTM